MKIVKEQLYLPYTQIPLLLTFYFCCFIIFQAFSLFLQLFTYLLSCELMNFLNPYSYVSLYMTLYLFFF